MAKLVLDIDPNLLKALIATDIPPEEFVNAVVNDPVSNAEVLAQLEAYHKDKGSAPHINKFRVSHVTYHQHSNTGKIELAYSIDRFYGCSDFSTSEQDRENWPFEIDAENLKLIINAPDFETLSPNEEF